MALLTCRDLSIGYDGREIVRDINFEVRAGDYLCIVGENGAGKSTLIKTLLGLLPPVGGQILTGDGLRQDQIGYLPQQTPIQRDFPTSVYEVVISGCEKGNRLRPFYTKTEKERARKNMERMGVTHLMKRCYRELSGGQQQRVLLARALCAADRMLLLDEPVAGLDPKVTADMYDLINSLNRDDGLAIIMISHDIHAALRYADTILHIGDAVFFGPVETYKESAVSRYFTGGGGEK